jgi:hypothetical protein
VARLRPRHAERASHVAGTDDAYSKRARFGLRGALRREPPIRRERAKGGGSDDE